MRDELEQHLYNDFPQFFRDTKLSVYESCMGWGIETEDGWYELLWDMCLAIKNANPPPEFRFAQVKEKFGELTVYCIGDTDEIFEIIEEFSKKSCTVCEYCGSTKGVTQSGSWIKTLCKNCRDKRDGKKEETA